MNATTNATAATGLGGYDRYGVGVNQMAAGSLFELYDSCGFLYPAKREQLAPVWNRVADSWDRSLAAPTSDYLHHCLAFGDQGSNCWGSVSVWRSTLGRVQAQHLVSVGDPLASRSVMLAAQESLNRAGFRSIENWFRGSNKYANRIFGTAPAALGDSQAAVETRELLAVTDPPSDARRPAARVDRLDDAGGREARAALAGFAHPVIADAEELDSGDIELADLDAMYHRVGLHRRRSVYLAHLEGHGAPVGIACAYRGPVGINFSFLENRCDLWLDAGLGEEERSAVARGLLRRAQADYADCPLPQMLVACDVATARVIQTTCGGRPVRTYKRCVWLRGGFWDWYRHVDSFYQKALRLRQRRERRPAAPRRGTLAAVGAPA
ncbi:hypothetical protein [Botrimarina sp.]|uniref:hypothetical protein n=1 Tax=Botrimarina sp. TaxID=2795802 RepID=UPI0032F03F0A